MHTDPPPDEMLPDRLRLPVEIDPAPLLTEAESLPDEAWIPHMVRQNYEGDWAAAPLMAPAGETHPIRQIYPDPTATRFVPTKFLDAMPATRALLAALPCETQCVRLMRLGPGAWIKPHRDHDLDAALGHARLHLPLATGPDVDFRLTGERVTMAAGELWYLRLSDTHEVNNRGSGPRLHLVIDVIANDWLVGALEAAGL